MARNTKSKPASGSSKKKQAAPAEPVKRKPWKKAPPRKDEMLPEPMKVQLQGIVDHLTPRLKGWIEDGADEESKLKAAKITIELLEFVQPKLTRVVLSEQESSAIARGVGAELRKQIAQRMLQDVPTGEDAKA